MHIAIVIDTMMHGGAHRVACLHANMLSDAGFTVTMIMLNQPLEYPYPISDRVKIVSLLGKVNIEKSSSLNKVKRHLSYLPSLLFYLLKDKKISLCISHIQGVNLNSILACRLARIKVIAIEHTTHKLPHGIKGKFASLERRYIYKLASAVTVLTKSELSYYSNFLENVHLLPNPLPFEKISIVDERSEQSNFILVAGDLNRIYIKGWDSLIHIFAAVSKENPNIRLKFAGASNGGTGLRELEELSNKLGVRDKIDFLGPVSNMKELYRKATLFLLTSRYEGFSMVIIEALSQGCPVVAFDCPSGPSELLENGINGILVKNQDIGMMINEVSHILFDNVKRKMLSENALKNVDEFTPNSILKKLIEIINSI